MARSRSRRVIDSSRPRRPMDWECGGQDGALLAADQKDCDWLIPPSDFRTGYTDPTLMSTMVWGQFVSIGPAGVTGIAGFGIIVVSAFDDAAPTAASCPGPVSDCDADWVYLFLAPFAQQDAGVRESHSPSVELDRRSQARRRLGNDKAILLVSELVGTSTDVNYHWHVRCLIKE